MLTTVIEDQFPFFEVWENVSDDSFSKRTFKQLIGGHPREKPSETNHTNIFTVNRQQYTNV